MATLFDISDELPLIDRAIDEWGTEPEQLFYGLRACGMVAVVIPVFEAEKVENGVIISAFGKFAIHEFAIRDGRVMIGSQALDSKIDAPPLIIFSSAPRTSLRLGKRPFGMSSETSAPSSKWLTSRDG